jgi:hypothetical protein
MMRPPSARIIGGTHQPCVPLAAELTGLPRITGLYTSMMCLLGYAVFGAWRGPIWFPLNCLVVAALERYYRSASRGSMA